MEILISIIKILVVMLVLLSCVAYLVLVERRVSAFIQNRIGPNRVGYKGLLQPVADVLKLFIKEDIVPKLANKPLHRLAPIIAIVVSMSTIAVVPFGDKITLFGEVIDLQIAKVNIGILYVLALTGLGVYGIAIAGWASNNKYSLLGGLRSSAQIISYELSMGISIIGVILVAGTLELDKIVEFQHGWRWLILLQPIGFITFFVAVFAETNRLPFDLPEAEPELVGGYHTEYTGLKFGLFFLAEYANMITGSAIVVTLYLGGWQFPYLQSFGLSEFLTSIIQVGTFAAKVGAVLLFMIVIRWTVPRFRYDQLMDLGWKFMLPLSIANVIVTALIIYLFGL